MRYLIAESIALKPHLEIAAEIGLNELKRGNAVSFVWLGNDLPWSDWHLPPMARWMGCSLDRRIQSFEKLIAENGIKIIRNIDDEKNWDEKIQKWAMSFNGNLSELQTYSYMNAPLGMGVASSLISYTGNSNYNPLHNLDRTRKCLASALLVFLRTEKVIRAFNPDVVVTFNGRFATSKPIITSAEAHGKKVLRHERGHTFTHYEIFSDAIHNFDYIRQRINQAWNVAESQKKVLLGHEFFQRRRRGDGIGWYSFTGNQISGQAPRKINEKKRIVYFSSSDDEFAAVTDAFKPGPWPSQLSAVNDLITVCSNVQNIELVIRVHPHLLKKSVETQIQWKQMASKGVKIINPSSKVDSYALMDSADIVITYGSTMGIEAVYWGKPSILLGPSSYRDSGVVLQPLNTKELLNMIVSDTTLSIASQESCLPYGFYHLSYGHKFTYYQPESFSEGRLLGKRLGWDPPVIFLLRKIGLGRIYRKLITKLNNQKI